MSIELTRPQRDERFYKLPDILRNLSHDNVVINDLIGQYVAGRIHTEQELLLQCIVHLTTSWDRFKKDYIDYKLMVVQPMILPHAP